MYEIELNNEIIYKGNNQEVATEILLLVEKLSIRAKNCSITCKFYYDDELYALVEA